MYFPTMPIYKTAWLKKEKKRNKKNPIKKKEKKNHTEKNDYNSEYLGCIFSFACPWVKKIYKILW